MIKKVIAENLLHNANYLKSKTKSKFCAVVKSDAYGHGIACCSLLQPLADCFAVASIQEAIHLRQVVKKTDIIVFGRLQENTVPKLVEYNLIQSITDIQDLLALKTFAESQNVKLCVDIKINSGFNRLGFLPSQCKEVVDILSKSPNIKLHGVYTHISDYTDSQFLQKQFDCFLIATRYFESFNPIFHCVSTNGIGFEQYHLDMVRSGIGLFGVGYPELKQVMSITSKIAQVNLLSKGDRVGYGRTTVHRESVIATVIGGYGQGILREVYKKVLIDDSCCPIIGSICMDYFMVDITDLIANHPPQDFVQKEVTISDHNLPLDKIATNANTIPYQLMVAFR